MVCLCASVRLCEIMSNAYLYFTHKQNKNLKMTISDCFIDGQGTELHEFLFINSTQTAEVSQLLCLKEEGNLARISTLEEFQFADEFLQQLNYDFALNGGRVLIGLQRESNVADPFDPLSFFFVDGQNENRSFFEKPGVFPWSLLVDLGQPNNFDGNQTVVEWTRVDNAQNLENNRWNDENPNFFKPALCRRKCSSIDSEEILLLEEIRIFFFENSIIFVTSISTFLFITLIILGYKVKEYKKLTLKLELL